MATSSRPVVAKSTTLGTPVDQLDTPAILVDLDRLAMNIETWQAAMNRIGVKFRPHIKTHKIPDIAQLQLAAGAVGIASAKVSEAEPFATAGIRDICLAYPIIGEQKWRNVAALARGGARMTVNADSEVGVHGLAEAATAAGTTINVQIDIDTGMHRGGVPVTDVDRVERLARVIMGLPGVSFDGITTHRGIFFEGVTTPEEAGIEEGRLLVHLADQLRARGVHVREVTAGGTFTARWAGSVPGVTEVRAGTYVFYDLMHVAAGTVSEDRLALSVLCSVVSQPSRGHITIDGGSKTFSGDRGVIGGPAGGSQAVARGVGRAIAVERLTEEHGMARLEPGESVAVGDKVRFYPFHACTCVNLSDELVGVRNGRVEQVWSVAARGQRT